jgi:hypothetical protein
MAVIPNLSRDEYVALPGINWSVLKAGRDRLGAHIRAAQRNPSKDKPAFKFGRAFHQAVLQPHLFAQWEIVAGKTTTKPGAITEDEERRISGMCTAWADLGLTVELQEAAITWEVDGIACKGMIDGLIDGAWFDLKSTLDASPGRFASECYRYGYHGQATWYLNGLRANGFTADSARLIAIEKEEPYASAQHILAGGWLDLGQNLIDELLAKWADTSPATYGTAELAVPEWADSDDLELTINGETVEI